MEHFKYKKFDLHLHTYKKANSWDNKSTISITKDNVKDFYDKLNENNVELIAITNHNYFNYENYSLIKNELENQEEKIKVLPGIELSNYYAQGEDKTKFNMNLIFDDQYEHLKDLDNKILHLFQNNIKSYVNIDDVLKFLSTNNIRGILILDAGKSSSKINIEEFDNDFWFFFDFFEGNISFETEKWNYYVNELKKKLKLASAKVANCVFGTDNINYKTYPDRDSRNGWTGTFFGLEPSFDGLRIGTHFQHLVKKIKKAEYSEENKHEPLFLPKLEDITISEINNIKLDRGLNVIYGKRGSGKTYFLDELENKLKRDAVIGLKTISQNEILKIIVLLKNNNANFRSKKSNIIFAKDELTKNKWDLEIKNNIVNKLAFNSEEINGYDFNQIIKEISNTYKQILGNEISNKNFDIEEELISKINVYFNKFDKDLLIVKKDLETISKIEFIDSTIRKSFFRNLSLKNFFLPINPYINSLLIKNKFDKIINNIEKKTSFELENKFKENIIRLISICKKNKSLIKNIQDKIIYLSNLTNQKHILFFNDLEIFSAEISYQFKWTKNIFEYIGKYFKISNLEKLKNNIFWKSDYQNNSNNSIKEYIEIKWNYKMGNEFIDKLSPGERANRYISDVFKDVSNKILLIDQPEDQLDAESATNSIIEPIKNRYQELIDKGIQMILVSHDPKIIINAGPINLIRTYMKDNSHLVENLSLVKFIMNEKNINIIDGKKEYVHGRSYLYGRNKD